MKIVEIDVKNSIFFNVSFEPKYKPSGINQHSINIGNNYNPSSNSFWFLVELSLFSTSSFENALAGKSESSTRNKNGLVEGLELVSV